MSGGCYFVQNGQESLAITLIKWRFEKTPEEKGVTKTQERTFQAGEMVKQKRLQREKLVGMFKEQQEGGQTRMDKEKRSQEIVGSDLVRSCQW